MARIPAAELERLKREVSLTRLIEPLGASRSRSSIERILAHRRERGAEAAPTASLGARAPPQASLF
jgi:hypothetical protein